MGTVPSPSLDITTGGKSSKPPSKFSKKSAKKQKAEKSGKVEQKQPATENGSTAVKEEDEYDYLKLLTVNKDQLDEFNEPELDEGLGADDQEDDEEEGDQGDFIEAMAALHGKKK